MSTALFMIGACATDSGQTGSPTTSAPPSYETPGHEPPQPPGGGSVDGGEGVGEPPEQVLPKPLPTPGTTALIGDRLLVAGRGSLAVMSVSTPTAPSLLGRLVIEGDTSLISARSLARVIVSANSTPHGSSEQIPSADVPFFEQQLLEVDATNPAAPVVVRRDAIPAGSVGVVVREAGYTALGGSYEPEGAPTCSGLGGAGLADIDLVEPPKPVIGLWLQRFGAGAAAGSARRDLGAGHFQVASDETHVIRIASPANTPITGELALEVIDADTLETIFEVTIPASELGDPSSLWPSADYAGGVLVVAAGPRLLGFDVTTGEPLAPVTTSSAIQGLRFLDANMLGLDAAGSPLARLDRTASSASLSLVPVVGDQFVGSLSPWGDGYVALDGTGGGPTPQLLRVSSYAIDESGALTLTDQLQTDWYFSTNWNNSGLPWHIDTAAARLTYSIPVDDGESGRIGVIRLESGELQSSNLAPVEHMANAPLVYGDAVLGFGRGLLEPVRIQADTSTLALESLDPITLALDGVWFEVEHAGRIWARHRKDTGESYVSVREGTFGEPLYLDVPHAVDVLVPVDATHIAAFGFSVIGLCDSLRELGPDAFPECGPNSGNGVTIISIENGEAVVGESIPLDSFMEGRPPEGIERSLDWQGYLEVAPSKWALFTRFSDRCSSDASCAALGVPAYHSMGTSGCSTGQECDAGPIEFVSGYYTRSWIFVLDLTDPDAPALAPAIREGMELRIPEDGGDLKDDLLSYTASNGTVMGYPNQEFIYDSDGSSVDDGHGMNLSRWFLQLMHSEGDSVGFDQRVNVPGEPVVLAASSASSGLADHTVFTLEPTYADGATESSMTLHRVRIVGEAAMIEESLDVGERLMSWKASEGLVALIVAPDDFCAEDATYELRVADARGDTLTLSEPLELPIPESGVSWYVAGSSEAGLIELGGGPARFAGRLRVDITSNPPIIISYEY